jgi:superfamily II DNA or RNA helicase
MNRFAKAAAIKKRIGSKKTDAAKVVVNNALSEDYVSKIRSTSYLGKKGYTIYKEHLLESDLEFLKKDLFMKPIMQGPQYGAPTEDAAFPVYKENAKKLYIPRFYGIQRYGLPSESEIPGGDDIAVDFVKPLRDYQDRIIDVYRNYVSTPICSGSEHNGSGGILEVPCGRGKCLGKDTPILMFDGSIKMVQDVIVGDLIMGDDSTARRVLTLARGKETMYKIVDKDSGESYIVNESHILSLVFKDTVVDISVTDYLASESRESYFGYRVRIEFPDVFTDVDPYTYSLNNEQSLPREYLVNSRKNRLKALAGIIDMRGYRDEIKGCYEIAISGKSDPLYKDILFLARSCGYVATYTDRKILVYGDETPSLMNTYKIDVERLDQDDYYGFEIDGNRRFVLGDFTVTHNTVMALKIISVLKKKTLIIVHKEFLMNQWIERAAEFVPGAKIGKIQGATFDVEGKDIVIGMLQTLYDRTFPEDAFECFGLTIIDEVHRIGSEQFSKTLLRVITPYMLGISATVDRKDGLTRVLHMFIGDKIYSEERKDDDPVCVRAIEYISADPEFNEVEYDFRGNTKFSTMITKLCAFGPRSDFIVRILGDLIKENAEAQIMVLCHNKSLLKYLFEAINHRAFATTGYYVGGMKQVALQETEEKQIVLATYAMAAEALDIKTLSTLVMVTPKTDIIQSVGRILRVKHESPIVVDVVDKHESFQNQWRQRRAFYKKCNYRIVSTDSVRYQGMTDGKLWTKVFEPKVNTAVDLDNSERKCLIKFDAAEFDE